MFGSKLHLLSKAFFNAGVIAKKAFKPKTIALTAVCLTLIPQYVHNFDNEETLNETPKGETEKLPDKKEEEKQENNTDPIINYITEYDDAQKLNLGGNTLIWYEFTGNETVDNEVISMLTKFVEKGKDSISCPYKIIIDKTPRSNNMENGEYYKKEIELVIIKSGDLKPIPLGKHLSFNGVQDLRYSALFERLNREINQFQELNNHNISEFIFEMGNRNHESFVIMNAPKNSVKALKARKRFNSFIESKEMFTSHTCKAIVTDEETAKSLGLPEYRDNEENIYIIVPKSDNLIQNGKTISIKNKEFHVFSPDQVNSSIVFPPYLEKSTPESLTLKITVDMNQNCESQLSEIYKILGNSANFQNLSSLPKMMLFQPITEKNAKPIRVSLEKNNFNQIVSIYSPNCRLSDEEKKEALKGESTWRFDEEEITGESLEKWIENVFNHKVEPAYESENLEMNKIKAYNSEKLNGEDYSKIFKSEPSKPKVIFHFSEHCHSCNKFKHIYEEIAGEQNKNFDFFRINNDLNRTKGMRNYNSTPIFVIYKEGSPFYFKNTIFTKAIFEDFIHITNKIERIETSVLDRLVEERKNNRFTIADLI